VKSQKKYFIFLLSFLTISLGYSQKDAQNKNGIDTATTMVWTGANFSIDFPFGKGYLSETFTFNYNVGTRLILKTKTNWTFDFFFNYMFGSNIKLSSDEVFGDLIDNNGSIFDKNGLKATIYIEGRYWAFGGAVGKIIPVDRWKNSGIWLRTSFGYLGHKIFITDPDNLVVGLERTTYRKGYDRLSTGFCMTQFAGYLFMRKKRAASFYTGIEISEMWTKPYRNYIFPVGSTTEMPGKFSGMFSIKIGWIVPLYEKKVVTTLYKY